jgi:glycosyltransferase involved in cell wall biosynthesis
MIGATLEGASIICFAPDPWDGLWRNRHQIMTRLARDNTVIYVEPRLYLGETLRRVRAGRLRLADLRKPLLTPAPLAAAHQAGQHGGLWLYHDPYYAPFAGRRSGGPVTSALRRRALRSALRRLGVRRPILWLLRPFHADQIGLYDERLVVYHVTDEYSDFPLIADKTAFLRDEEALLRRADLVIVTSPGLLASKGQFNARTYLVPNAVDYAGFQAALADPARRFAAADAIPHPRIGYVGALNEKIAFDLLAHIAQARPEWQLVLVGAPDLTAHPHKADVLRQQPNVHWLGRVPVSQVPGAIASMDACLLPYERNAWTANIDSLKLYEYLACGKPVISTDVPAARSFAHLVRIADGPEAFVTGIETALTNNVPEVIAARRAAAAANTWDMRVAQISTLLAEALPERAVRKP